MLVIFPIKISFVSILFVYPSRAATGAGPVVQRTSSSSLSRGRNSSFGGSGRIGDLPGTYPARRPAQRELVATKSKIWDRKEVEQKRTNNALRAHTAVLTTAGNAAIGVAKAGTQHLSNKFNVHATPEQKNYSKNVLHDAAHNLVTAPKQVYKESSDMLHNSKLKKGIAVHDYHKARKGGNPYHQQPYTNQENDKIATNYHHEINNFYDKVHSRNQNLRNPGTAQGHAVGYPATAIGYPVNSGKKA